MTNNIKANLGSLSYSGEYISVAEGTKLKVSGNSLKHSKTGKYILYRKMSVCVLVGLESRIDFLLDSYRVDTNSYRYEDKLSILLARGKMIRLLHIHRTFHMHRCPNTDIIST